MGQNVISIDIGNTIAHFGLVDPASLSCVRRLSCPAGDISQEIVKSISSLFENAPDGNQGRINISSVVKQKKLNIQSIIKKSFPKTELCWVCYHSRLPIKCTYKNPDGLGADRVANLLYCKHAFPNKDVLVIDAGTAVTLDYLSKDGVFSGGFILPGVNAQLRSLHSSTSVLPLITIKKSSLAFPATSTEECMLSGVVYGLAGSISSFMKQFKNICSEEITIVTCGGDWPVIESLVDFEYKYLPDCTLVGTALFTK